jgi:hypothetical protein
MSFQAVQKKIAAKDGVPMKNAGAILASASRNASPAAKKKNPKLLKVKGKAKGKAKGAKKGAKAAKRSAKKPAPAGPSRLAQAMGGMGGGAGSYSNGAQC